MMLEQIKTMVALVYSKTKTTYILESPVSTPLSNQQTFVHI